MNTSRRIRTVALLGFLAAGLLWVACPSGAAAQEPQPGAVSVVINEVLASNTKSSSDPQGDFDDWIELYNPGDTPVEVGGMYLTDDLAVPTKWQFPTNDVALTTIGPQGYLAIWADNQVTDSGLHAGFKLSSSGETVGLFDRDGTTLIDSVSFGAQRADVSYGRLPDDLDTWVFLTFPTLGAPNFRVHQGFTEKPECSPQRGFYTKEILVSLACRTDGAIIYYTTDGSEPYQTDRMAPGSRATVYGGPIRITRTTCLRAAAIKPLWVASPTVTNTYIFLQDVVTQSPGGAKPASAWPASGVNGQRIDYGMDPDVVNDPGTKTSWMMPCCPSHPSRW